MASEEEAVIEDEEEEYMEDSDSQARDDDDDDDEDDVDEDVDDQEDEDDDEEEDDEEEDLGDEDSDEEEEEEEPVSRRKGRSKKAVKASPPARALRSSRENLGLRSRKAVNYNEVEIIGQRQSRPQRNRKKTRKVMDSSDEESAEEEVVEEEEESDEEEEVVVNPKKRLPDPPLDVSSLVADFDTTGEYDVEKILSHRDKKGTDETEYLVKWKRKSYAQCEWVDADTFDDRLSQGRLKRYLDKNPLPFEDIDMPFHSSYTSVDRIVSHKYRKGKIKYLVKWQQLQYSESTWEWPEDIADDALIEDYKKRLVPPPASSTKIRPRKPNSWKKFEQSPQYKNDHELRPYQLEGLNWLTFCWHHSRNSILADEMGLGKTVQTVSVINYLNTVIGIRGPFLIVAPLITIPHWKREFENWTNMSVVVHHGTKESREIIRRSEFYFTKAQARKKAEPYKFNVLITTYEMTLSDSALLSGIRWRYLAIDEAHRLKNKDCRLITTLRTFRFDHSLLLTGTPLQNNTEELWTLLNFMEPKEFESLSDFLEEFGELKEASQVEKLHDILRPYLLRRMKEDVEKSIAPKEETIVEVDLTPMQKKYYRAILDKNFQSLNMGAKTSNLPSLMNVLMQLRKCCNHPFLLKGVEDNIIETARNQERAKRQLSSEAPDPDVSVDNLMIEASGKLFLIDRLLPKLRAGGHRVLVFSQMVRMLDILEDYAQYRKYPYERIDGSKRGNDRQAAIDRFSAPDSDRFLFFLCTRAGGLGINLTAADTCIIYDSDWNPQNDIQAQARCHRIGQTQSVKIYRLVTRRTYETHMLGQASRKLGLDQAVLKRMKGAGSTSATTEDEPPPLDKKQIDILLRHGAYGAFDDENSQDNFTEEDIDKILGRSSTVVHDANGPSTFSKANFCPTSNAGSRDVDVNDPDFWKKVLPNARTEDPLIQYQPRKRRQVQRFGGIDEDGDVFDIDEDSELEYQDEEATPGWTNRERARLKTFLLEYGYGQWRTVRLFAKLDRWSLAEIKEYTDCLLQRFLAELGESNADEVLELIQNNFIPERVYLEEADDEEEEEEDKKEEPTADDEEASTAPEAKSSTEDVAMTEGETPVAEAGTAEDVEMTDKGDETAKEGEEDTAATVKAEEEGEQQKGEAEEDAEEGDGKPKNQFEDDPSLNDEVFDVYKQRNARLVIKRLEGIAKASRSLLHLVGTYGDSLEIPDVGGELPTSWWTKEDDKSAILGAYYHGYSQYDFMRFDPRLSFLKHSPKAAAKKRREEEAAAAAEPAQNALASTTAAYGERSTALPDGEPPTDARPPAVASAAPSEQILSTDVEMGEAPAASQSLTVSETPAVSHTPSEEPSVASLPQEDVVMGEASSVAAATAPAGASVSAGATATVEGAGAMVRDSEEEIPGEKSTGEEEEEEEEWPAPKVLTRRLRKVLRALGIAYQGIERKRKALLKKEEKEQTKGSRKRKGQISSEWSKRERLDLYRAIVTFGLPESGGMPDWSFVKEKAKLNKKSEEHIAECYRALVSQAEDTVKTGKDPPRLQLAASTEGEPEETLSLQQCKRIIQRLKLFKDLRSRVLSARSRLPEYVKNAPNLPQLPLWWRPEVHDVGLVKGTVKHGFGKWEKICSDPALPFFSLARERLALADSVESVEEDVSGLSRSSSNLAASTDSLAGGREDTATAEGSQESKGEQEKDETNEKDAKKKKKPKRGRKTEIYTTALNFPKDKVLTKRLEQVVRHVVHAKKPKQQLYIKDFLLTADQNTEQKNTGEKRKRPKTAAKKKYVDVPLNEDGTPKMPIGIGNVTVLSLGRVEHERDSYSNWRYIWPIGYKSTRMHYSFIDPQKKVLYTSEILDGGASPLFRVTAEDCPEEPSEGTSPSAAWSAVLKRVAVARGDTSPTVKKRSQFAVSGPDYFGVSTGTIAKLLQEMPNAHLCTRYGMQQFEKREVRTQKPRKVAQADTPASARANVTHWHPTSTFSANQGSAEREMMQNGQGVAVAEPLVAEPRALHPPSIPRVGSNLSLLQGGRLPQPGNMGIPGARMGANTLAPFVIAPSVRSVSPPPVVSARPRPYTSATLPNTALSLAATESIEDFDDSSAKHSGLPKAPSVNDEANGQVQPQQLQQPQPQQPQEQQQPQSSPGGSPAFGFTHANGRSVNILAQSPQ